MKDENKLIDAIIDLSQESKGMRKDIRDMNSQLGELNHKVEELNGRVDGVEKQQMKTNLLLAEHSRSIMALAEQQDRTNAKLDVTNTKLDGLRSDFNKYARTNNANINGHEKRIVKLEKTSYGNGGKARLLAKEPKTKYGKKKK